jgi:hypothetical protein
MHTLLTKQSLGARLARHFLSLAGNAGLSDCLQPAGEMARERGQDGLRRRKTSRHLDPDFLGYLGGRGDPGLLRILLSTGGRVRPRSSACAMNDKGDSALATLH